MRHRNQLGLIVLGLAAGLAFIVGSDREPPDDRGIAARITAEVRRGPGTIVDMRTLAPFHWTRFYVFGPYRTKDDAERVLHMRWPYDWSRVEYNDDLSFLVFVDSGRVVATLDQQNGNGVFMELFREAGYSPDSARFVVRDRGRLTGGAPYYELEWRP